MVHEKERRNELVAVPVADFHKLCLYRGDLRDFLVGLCKTDKEENGNDC